MEMIRKTLILLVVCIIIDSCKKDDDVRIKPTLTTTEVNGITATTATCGGSITADGGAPVSARGVVWSTIPDPSTFSNLGITSDSIGTGSFTSNLVDLAPANTYYVRAYATNSVGTAYGNQQTFETLGGVITLTTKAVTGITTTTAVCGGNVDSDGGAPVTARGVVWSTMPDPTTTANQGMTSDSSGTGPFISSLTDLTLSTAYYVRAYATNSIGTTYGNQQAFETLNGVITLTTTAVTGITTTTAVSGGNIDSDGGAPVTAQGVVWSTTPDPTTVTNQGITIDSTGTGSFSSSLTSLTPTTTYYVRAYATNSVGTQYGNQVVFTTPMPDGPGVTITDADGNTYNTIWINNRQWTKENLSTTKYNDGGAIPLYTIQYGSPQRPVYFLYDNNIVVKPHYGALYNFYAVNTGKLCPTGWHVPTDAEWYAMESYVDSTINNPAAVGSRGVDGGTKLKATSGWPSQWPNGNGTDIFGFSGLPGGVRFNYGLFGWAGHSGYWWTSTVRDSTYTWCRILELGYTGVARGSCHKTSGLSVRCVKDN